MFMREVHLKNPGLYKCFNIFSWHDKEHVTAPDRHSHSAPFETKCMLENIYTSVVVPTLLLAELVQLIQLILL